MKRVAISELNPVQALNPYGISKIAQKNFVFNSLSSQSIEIVPDPERMRPVENPYICCDNTRIREYWGGTAIEETIQGMVKWYGEWRMM